MLPTTFYKLCCTDCRKVNINFLPFLIKKKKALKKSYLITKNIFSLNEVFSQIGWNFSKKQFFSLFCKKIKCWCPLLHRRAVQPRTVEMVDCTSLWWSAVKWTVEQCYEVQLGIVCKEDAQCALITKLEIHITALFWDWYNKGS